MSRRKEEKAEPTREASSRQREERRREHRSEQGRRQERYSREDRSSQENQGSFEARHSKRSWRRDQHIPERRREKEAQSRESVPAAVLRKLPGNKRAETPNKDSRGADGVRGKQQLCLRDDSPRRQARRQARDDSPRRHARRQARDDSPRRYARREAREDSPRRHARNDSPDRRIRRQRPEKSRDSFLDSSAAHTDSRNLKRRDREEADRVDRHHKLAEPIQKRRRNSEPQQQLVGSRGSSDRASRRPVYEASHGIKGPESWQGSMQGEKWRTSTSSFGRIPDGRRREHLDEMAHMPRDSLPGAQLREQPVIKSMPEEPNLPAPPPLPPPPLLPQPTFDANDPKLDFFSEQFDAKLALATQGLLPPNLRVRPLQMLRQCRFILPPEMDESLADREIHLRPEEAEELRKARIGPVAKRRQAEELKQSTVGQIAEAVTKGPLLLLKNCYQNGERICIVTRHARGIRGSATGVLKAFDKQMNLVLQEVEEQYTVRLKIQRTKPVLKHRSKLPKKLLEGLEGPSNSGDQPAESPEYVLIDSSRTVFKQEQRSRTLKQIFVRGSNIVLISRVQMQERPQPS